MVGCCWVLAKADVAGASGRKGVLCCWIFAVRRIAGKREVRFWLKRTWLEGDVRFVDGVLDWTRAGLCWFGWDMWRELQLLLCMEAYCEKARVG